MLGLLLMRWRIRPKVNPGRSGKGRFRSLPKTGFIFDANPGRARVPAFSIERTAIGFGKAMPLKVSLQPKSLDADLFTQGACLSTLAISMLVAKSPYNLRI